MAFEPDEGRPPEEEEEEGGPVKTFLEHLEDLRWMLIKSGAALGIAVVVCLLGGNYVVDILLRPLKKAKISYPGTNHVVTLSFGTNRLGVYVLDNSLEKAFFSGNSPPTPNTSSNSNSTPGNSISTNSISTNSVSTNSAPAASTPKDASGLGTNRFVALELVPVTITNGGAPIRILAIALAPDQSSAESAQHINISIANFGPADAFMTAFHVAIYAGIALSSPFIFYYISQFVFPALRMREKRYIYRGLFFGLGLFITGVLFCYFVMLPLALGASQVYSNWLGFNASIWKAEEYIGFVCKFMLGMGLGFEMPVVILVLVKLGVLNYRILSKARPYMIVLNFLLGAILTTPEVITQVAMAIPLQLLFEVSVWIAWYWERQDRKRAERETLSAD